MSEGRCRLVISNPTQNGTDGILASSSSQEYPVNVIVNTAVANHTLFKAAIRCDDGYQTVGDWEISFVGTTNARWSIANGVQYATEDAAEYASYNSSLTSTETVTNKNHVVWLRAETDGVEQAQVDTSVKIRLYARVVPVGGA